MPIVSSTMSARCNILSDEMFGWSSDSHDDWLKSMITPPCSPPMERKSQLDFLDDSDFVNEHHPVNLSGDLMVC